MKLDKNDRRVLLARARESICIKLFGRNLERLPEDSGVLHERQGAFVTLKKHGCLRGCVGYIEPRKPLHEAVEQMAQAAAFDDPRFPALDPEELDEIDIEISVLTPLKQVASVEEIEIGKHGLYVVKGFYSGLLLPQVATEQGWDREAFLKETCRKAGLSPDAWQDKETKIFSFSAVVFGEQEEGITKGKK